ncbi:hypothetical protein X975_08633, partial [Stegodyphus mimosarum]
MADVAPRAACQALDRGFPSPSCCCCSCWPPSSPGAGCLDGVLAKEQCLSRVPPPCSLLG